VGREGVRGSVGGVIKRINVGEGGGKEARNSKGKLAECEVVRGEGERV